MCLAKDEAKLESEGIRKAVTLCRLGECARATGRLEEAMGALGAKSGDNRTQAPARKYAYDRHPVPAVWA